ncbi:hypothetical protein GCM10009746_28840 [Microbacterium paludicola]
MFGARFLLGTPDVLCSSERIRGSLRMCTLGRCPTGLGEPRGSADRGATRPGCRYDPGDGRIDKFHISACAPQGRTARDHCQGSAQTTVWAAGRRTKSHTTAQGLSLCAWTDM